MESPSTTAFWKNGTFRKSFSILLHSLFVDTSTCYNTNHCQQIKNRHDVICFDNYTQCTAVCSLQHMSYLNHITRVNFYLKHLYLSQQPSTVCPPLHTHKRDTNKLLLHNRASIISSVPTADSHAKVTYCVYLSVLTHHWMWQRIRKILFIVAKVPYSDNVWCMCVLRVNSHTVQ